MHRDHGYLLYMLMAARRVIRSVSDITRAEFDANDEKKDSVVLQIGNIGEAASHISHEFRQRHAAIPWIQIINMRHRVFHGYEAVDWDKVWEIATELVPNLIRRLEPLIPPDEGGTER